MTVIEPAAGTDESSWTSWAAPSAWPRLDVAALARHSVVVLAAHPDDEVLGVGGLLARLAGVGSSVRIVWATDGEASHPGAPADVVRRLAQVRRLESARASDILGLGRAPRVHLGLPDGGLTDDDATLPRLLAGHVGPDDVVLAPWSGDGHPDHESCGRAAAAVSDRVLEYPIWAWHWGVPDDPRMPWSRALRIDLDDDAQRRKAKAVACFASQIRPLGSADCERAVLPARVLAHFRRDYEVVLR